MSRSFEKAQEAMKRTDNWMNHPNTGGLTIVLSTPSTIGREFHPFKKLPLELKVEIWKFSFEPRTIELCFSSNSKSNQYGFVPESFPAVLVVHKESRKEALRFYPYLFVSKQCKRCVNFNPELDTLHIGPARNSMQLYYTLNRLPDKEKITKLSIIYDSQWLEESFFYKIPRSYNPKPRLLGFPCLKVLYLGHAVSDHPESATSDWHAGGNCNNHPGSKFCFPPEEEVQINSTSNVGQRRGQDPIEKMEGKVVEFIHNIESNMLDKGDWQIPAIECRYICFQDVWARACCPWVAPERKQRVHINREAKTKALMATDSLYDENGEEL